MTPNYYRSYGGRLFSAYKSPPSSGEGNEEKQSNNTTRRDTNETTTGINSEDDSFSWPTGHSKVSKTSSTKRQDDLPTPIRRFKNTKRKEWKDKKSQQQQHQQHSVFRPTLYYCKRRHHRDIESSSRVPLNSVKSSKDLPSVLKSINAAAILNPRDYCASSAKSTHTHNVYRSINGTDAARRLLRGKKDFFVAAREMINSSPLMLKGHNVPPQLLQHFIDMGDRLLRHYGRDAVECSFHNYHDGFGDTSSSSSSQSNDGGNHVSLPLHVRVRQRDATNACLPPPSSYDTRVYDENEIDWDYHLQLYLMVMQNLTSPLGKVFHHTSVSSKSQDKSTGSSLDESNGLNRNRKGLPPIDEYKFENDDEQDFTASPLLFESPPPRWNVDILRGEFYDLQPIQGDGVTLLGSVLDRRRKNDNGEEERLHVRDDEEEQQTTVPPFPIVEFVQESSRTPGHVLVRLQGVPASSRYFGTEFGQRRPQPVTLVFDAGYYRSSSMTLRNN